MRDCGRGGWERMEGMEAECGTSESRVVGDRRRG